MLYNVLKAALTDSKESVGKDRSENEAIAAGVVCTHGMCASQMTSSFECVFG
jgi:hypothetical protein